jgi:hypothetical protein
MSGKSQAFLPALMGALLLLAFGLSNKHLLSMPRDIESGEMAVKLPVVAQVLLAGGDRYLAAFMGTLRALVADIQHMTPDEFALQARIQEDVAWLNPAHEDNYYIAAAVLPWNGQIEASQYILTRAADARPFDWQPPFYVAFNHYYFLKDPIAGARWLRRASAHTESEQHRLAFQQIAALWAAKSPDLQMAIRLHEELIESTKHREFAAFLEKRIQRLRNLLEIEKASVRYTDKQGRGPKSVGDLVVAGVLGEVPSDPFGMQYGFDANGAPAVVAPAQPARKGR